MDRLICQNKDCQEVYSSQSGALVIHCDEMKCDSCSSELGRRNDDAVAAVKERLQMYHKHEQDLIDFYEKTPFELKEFDVEKPLKKCLKNLRS